MLLHQSSEVECSRGRCCWGTALGLLVAHLGVAKEGVPLDLFLLLPSWAIWEKEKEEAFSATLTKIQ